MVEMPRSPVWELVQRQAERTPEAVAVQASRTLTYAQLSESVTALAERILASMAAGSVVALDATDTANGAVGVLAGVRSGCPVLPLSRQNPAGHTARVLAAAGPALVLRELPEGGWDVDDAPLRAGSWSPREPMLSDVAYIMYTSGSTGTPKGVMVSHKALADRLVGLAAVPGLSAGEKMAGSTALSFDISMAEMLLPLVVGASLINVPLETRGDPLAFAAFVAEHEPDVLQATPSFWRMLLAGGGWTGAPHTRIWCGGEALTPSLADRLLPRCAELWNLYGPTEATIWATAARVESADRVSLGHPLEGTTVELVPIDATGADAGDAITEPGRPGEIVLSGAGLALGYLDQAALTAERFPVRGTPHGRRRCYRTGDSARFRTDGSLDFLGRLDNQIKLRGHRVELGGIEAALEEHPDVSAAVVLVRDADRPERASLTAFVTVRQEDTSEQDILGWVRERVPAGHCPDRVVVRSSLPRTTAGKVDRVRLAVELGANPATGPGASAPAASLPRSHAMTIATKAWREVLETADADEHQNFFDAGGTSILLGHLQERLSADFGFRFPVREIFKHPTISGIVDYAMRRGS